MSNGTSSPSPVTYYVDEAGDGVLFGPMGRDRLQDADAPQFSILGMVRCADAADAARQLAGLRAALQKNPLYATIYSLKPGGEVWAVFDQERCPAQSRANKKPMDIGFTGLKARNTRHEAEFCPPVSKHRSSALEGKPSFPYARSANQNAPRKSGSSPCCATSMPPSPPRWSSAKPRPAFSSKA